MTAAAGIAVAASGDLSPSVPILDVEVEVESFAAEMAVDLETARAMLQAQQVSTTTDPNTSEPPANHRTGSSVTTTPANGSTT